jgi:protein dithiol oxidoreductase (disulfide-forming)
MKGFAAVLLACAGIAVYAPTASAADPVEGVSYYTVEPQQALRVPPGTVEVTEVFSYACPACNEFHTLLDQFEASLPKRVVLDYVPASFSPAEDWPVFQRAFLTAQELGLINPRLHDAMFDAVWKTGQLAVVDYATDRIKKPAPTIADTAAFYAARTGVKAAAFVAAANSFGVDVKVRQADQYVAACQVDSTPTMIIDGKYRVSVSSAGGYPQLIAVTKWLVQRELAALSPAATAPTVTKRARHSRRG